MAEKIVLKRKNSHNDTYLQRSKRTNFEELPYDEDVVEEPVEEAKPVKKIDDEAVRRAKEEAARKAAEEAARKAAEEEAARKAAEEEAARKAAEEEAARKAAEEEAARKAAEEEAERRAEEQRKMEELQREQISASEVKEIVSDETAQILIEKEEETEKIYGTKKGIINLDVISRNFEAGEVVTINTLKEKKLIDKNIGFIKVLARGVIDKPLTVKAQDFSIDAAKMIQLTGGKVVMLTKKKYFD